MNTKQNKVGAEVEQNINDMKNAYHQLCEMDVCQTIVVAEDSKFSSVDLLKLRENAIRHIEEAAAGFIDGWVCGVEEQMARDLGHRVERRQEMLRDAFANGGSQYF